MELLQLEYFYMVAKHESISKAAKLLHVSQPALSISIAKLEDELGIKLFDRVRGRVRLNASGKAYLQRVNQVFLTLREAKNEIDTQAESAVMPITVVETTMGMCAHTIEEYIKTHPKQPLRFYAYSDNEVKEQLESGDIDFAVCARQIFGQNIVWTPLFNERLVVVVPANHPLADRRYVELSDLRSEKFVVQQTAAVLQGEFAPLFDNVGYEPKTIISTNELELALRAVDAGAGIMVMAFLTANRLARHSSGEERHVNIPLRLDDFHRDLGIAHLSGHYFTPAVHELFTFIVDSFAEQHKIQEEFFSLTFD